MIQSKDATRKERLNAVSLLMHMYDSRLARMSGAPEVFLNAKKSVSEADFRKALDSNPILQQRV